MFKHILLLAVVALSLVARADVEAEAKAGSPPPPADLAVIHHATDLYEQYDHDSQSLSATPETIAQQNADVFAELGKWQARTNSRTQAIDLQQANEIMQASMENYVAGKKSVKAYDPQGNVDAS
jgi:hypothetical protein